jgi:methionine-rich copper-binding protein CopC
MRYGPTNCRTDNPVESPRRSGLRDNRLKITVWLLAFLTVVTPVNNASANAIIGIEPKPAIDARPAQTDRPAATLYAPKQYRPDFDETKILVAHAIIVRTSPPQGGVAPGTIGKVDVWYDAGIRDSLAALAVISASGERVDKRDAAIDSADPAHVSVSVNPMSPGKYTVRYRALSADGHMVSGAWEFDVQP